MDKREYRQLKRTLKKAGNRKLRRQFKAGLQDHPEEAHWDQPDYGNCKTSDMKRYSREKDDYRDEHRSI